MHSQKAKMSATHTLFQAFAPLSSTTTTSAHPTLILSKHPHSIMAPAPSALVSSGWKALVRLFNYLFGRGRFVHDAESGMRAPADKFSSIVKTEVSPKDVPTYRPDVAGVPALVLASMSVGAALLPGVPIGVKEVVVPLAVTLPTIVVTPPPKDDTKAIVNCVGEHETSSVSAKLDDKAQEPETGRHVPLRHITNTMNRVHGKTPRIGGKPEKENNRHHPNAPRRPPLLPGLNASPRSTVLISPVPSARNATVTLPTQITHSDAHKPGSANWEKEKARHLQEALTWSNNLKSRRRSFPAPLPPAAAQPTRRVSLPARLSLDERLRQLLPPVSKDPPAPLWGDDNVSFVLNDDDEEENEGPQVVSQLPAHNAPTLSPSSSSSSSTDSIASILDAFEEELRSSKWIGLRSLANLQARQNNGGQDEQEQQQEDGEDGDQWSDLISLEDYA
ncbi:hypothetical protein C8R43DRAFT_18972 [Mycena crocata]|nr:hypothetical protein C8R43DRAFT_18972 [Mycena crocata]